jgi:hypothetical protein
MGKISTYAQVSSPSLSDKVIGTDVSNMDATKNFTIADILSLGSSSGLLVPYTGATGSVDLGVHTIRANSFVKQGGTASQFLKADGSVDTNTYALASSLSSYVPYTGAVSSVNLGSNNITANSFIKVGGLSTQFLKADGSVDTNTYLTTSNFSYGSFYDTLLQTALVNNTAYPIKLNTTDVTATNGISVLNDGLGNPTLIKATVAGVYNVAFSAQLQRTTGGSSETVDIWLRKNGTNLAWTNTAVNVQANAGYLVTAWNFFVQMDAGAEIQLMWSTTSTAVQIVTKPANGVHPETPSVILTINKVN